MPGRPFIAIPNRTEAAAETAVLAVSAARFWSLFLALWALAAVPILLAEVPPLFDYPNHLARMYLLLRLPDSAPLGTYYTLHWAALPNLAMDLIVPVLARAMPLDWAAKAFLLTTLALMAAGAAALNRAVSGRWTLWPLGAFLFLYSRVLLWGFLNYLFGVGLALLALAAWIALAERSAWLRMAVGAFLALATFFAHLMAAIVLAAMIAGYEVGRLRCLPTAGLRAAAARLGAVAVAFAIPAVLFLGSPHSGLAEVSFSGWGRKFDLPFSVFDDYHRAFDVACFVLLVLGSLLLFARRRIEILRPLRLPLLVLTLLYLMAPAQIMTASAVDHRLPLVVALLGAAGTASRRLSASHARLLAIGCCALFAVRMSVVAVAWERASRDYRRDLAVLDRLPEGARLALAYPSSAIAVDAAPKTHLPLLAVIRREAFVPTLFAYPGQQPVLLTPLGQTLAAEAEPSALWSALWKPDAEAVATALAHFDFLLALDRRPFDLPASALLQPIAREPEFALYRIRH